MEITGKGTDRLENTFSKSLNIPKVINKKTYNFSMK